MEYARKMEEAGASALELNVYFIAADVDETGEQVERRYLDLVAAVRRAVGIPLAVKVGPYFSSMANMARRLVEAGADGLVLFNRFYQPDIDLEDLKVRPNVELSTSAELRLPLRWIAILKGRVNASLAATTGVHTAADVLKLVMAGADVAMSASALLKQGPAWLTQGARRDGLLDGGARVRLHRADEGVALPGGVARPGGLRAGQLHGVAHHLRHADALTSPAAVGEVAEGRRGERGLSQASS